MSYTASYIVNSSSAQGTTDFQFTFPYIKEEHIEVFLNYNKITQGSGSAQYQVITNVSPKLIRLNTGIASANLRVEVRRNSSLGSPLVDYADGSTLTANDLDTSALQSLYIDQELKDNQGKTVSVDETTALPELNNLRLTKVADPTAAQDAATKNYVDTKQFTSAQIQDGTLVNADVNASAAIDGTKISPNFGSQNIVTSGTVDGRDVSNDGTKLDSIETGATADQTNAEIRAAVEAASDSNVFTDADHSKLNAIEAGATADQTNAEIRAAVEAATDSNVFTDADHSKLNAIEASATADQTSSEIKTLLQSDKLTAGEIADGTITSTQIATGALDGRYYTETESDARYFNVSTGDTIKDGDTFPDNDTTIATTAAINDRIIDLVDDVGGFVPIASETNFPTANPDVNNGAGTLISVKAIGSTRTPSSGTVSISNGSGSNTVTITGCGSTVLTAGFGVIVETTSTLHTYAFHRLVPKATEVTTVAGNISNINSVASNESNINSAVSNASNINSAVSNATNINSVAGNISNVNTVAGNNSNITTVAGANSNISTVATNISNVNNVGGSISNVNTVASNISGVNDFADRYRVASSAPTSSLDTGDLYFDTTANELKVYNGSAWQGGVTATGNLAGLGANTFTGNQSLGDNVQIRLGSSDDLKVYHDGSNSYLWDTGTGDLHIMASDDLKLRSDDIHLMSYSGDETFARFIDDGATELYYDNSKKLETTSSGVLIDGSNTGGSEVRGDFRFKSESSGTTKIVWDGSDDLIRFFDNSKAVFGTSNDLQIVHDGSHSYIQNNTGDLRIDGDYIQLRAANGENYLIGTANGNVKLYYDGSQKFETESVGTKTTGFRHWVSNPGGDTYIDVGTGATDNRYAYLDLVGDTTYSDYGLRLIRNDSGANTDSSLKHRGTGALNIQCVDAAELRFLTSSSTRWRIESGGDFKNASDNLKIKLGVSDDLQIYHNGSNSYVKNSTGGLYIGSTTEVAFGDEGINEFTAKFIDNGAAELYYDSSKKFHTHSTGVTVTGYLHIEDGSTGIGLGNSDDLKLYHDGSNSYIQHAGGGNLRIEAAGGTDEDIILKAKDAIILQPADGEAGINVAANGSVHLYYDSVVKLSTDNSGVLFYQHAMFGDNDKALFGTGNDLQIYHDGTDSKIVDTGTGMLRIGGDNTTSFENAALNEYKAKFVTNGQVELYHDNAKKLETYGNGVVVTGTVAADAVNLNDNKFLYCGTGADLKIYHDGTYNLITASNNHEIKHSALKHTFYDYTGVTKRAEINSSGLDVTGALTVNGAALSSGMPVHTANGANVGNGEAFLLTSTSAIPSSWSWNGSSFTAKHRWIGWGQPRGVSTSFKHMQIFHTPHATSMNTVYWMFRNGSSWSQNSNLDSYLPILVIRIADS